MIRNADDVEALAGFGEGNVMEVLETETWDKMWKMRLDSGFF